MSALTGSVSAIVSGFWSFLLRQGNTYGKEIGSQDSHTADEQLGYLPGIVASCVCVSEREKTMTVLVLFRYEMGEFLNQKICSLKHPFLSPLLFLTSNPFTLAQDNSKWLEDRLPQKFCGTSSSSKCSSSEEKGEVQKTSYLTPSRKKRSIIKGRQQCLWCRWLSAVDYC